MWAILVIVRSTFVVEGNGTIFKTSPVPLVLTLQLKDVLKCNKLMTKSLSFFFTFARLAFEVYSFSKQLGLLLLGRTDAIAVKQAC